MTAETLNIVRREAQRQIRNLADPRIGIVDGFDPTRYAARVLLLPERQPTGWLPVTAQWMGNGWGMLSPVGPGDQVLVIFQEHDKDSGIIVGRLFDTRNAPPQLAPYGECWLVHQSGSFFKLTNDGKIGLNSGVEIDIGELANTVLTLVTQAFQALYNGHTHPDPQGGNSGAPNQQMTAAHLTAILKAN